MTIDNTAYKDIKEIAGIQYNYNGIKSMRAVCFVLRRRWKRIYKIPFSTMIISGVSDRKYLTTFISLIKKNKLGELMGTDSKRNPNSGRNINAYVWTVDKKELSRWFYKNRIKKEESNNDNPGYD